MIVYSTLFMANAILVEAALSFLGLGVQPPTPSWGLMVSTGRDFLLVAPHVATVPGLAIMVAVLGFNLLGDGLRDALDPRLRGRSSHAPRGPDRHRDGRRATASAAPSAWSLAREGAAVWALRRARARARGDARARWMPCAAGRVPGARVVDVRDAAAVGAFVARVEAETGRVDVLVNTAGGVAGQVKRRSRRCPTPTGG